MAQRFGKLVQEDLNVGTDLVWITAPGGGELRTTQVGLHSFARGQKEYTAAWTPGAIATTGKASTTVTVPSALVGDFVMASHDKMLTNGLRISGHVSAAGTAKVVIHNPTSSTVTVAAGTVSVLVFPAVNASSYPDLPIAEFSSNGIEGGLVGEGVVEFTDETTGGTAPYTYAWDFGDSVGTSTEASPNYTYSQGGGPNPQTFTVTLTVTDDAAEVDSVEHDVEVTFNE